MSTVATQSFDIEKIKNLQESYIPNGQGVLYLTTQIGTAEYFSTTPLRFGGGGVLGMRVKLSEWQAFMATKPDVQFMTPVAGMDGMTETTIPFAYVKEFESYVKKNKGIRLVKTTDENGNY